MRERGRVVFVVALVAAAILLWLMFGQGERAGSNDEERTPASVGVERDGGRLASPPEHARTSPSEREADADEQPAPELGAHRPLRARVHADSSLHGALVGRVINWSTREGVAAAELGFVQDGVTHTLATDASGSFRFVAPGPGTWQLATITADGYLPYAPELGRGSVRFVARAGQRIEHADLFLFPAIDYHGRVVDAEGEPVADAAIELFAADSGERTLVGIESSFRSDSHGKFVFHAPDSAVLEAHHAEHGRGRAMLDEAAQRSHELIIELGEGASEPGAPITGRVIDAQGVGLDGIEVRAEPGPGVGTLARAPAVVSEADGSFELAPLDASAYVIVASLPGRPSVSSEPVSPGAEVELRMSDGLRLRGRLIDEERQAIPAGTVALLRVEGLRRSRVAAVSVFDARGEFVFEGLAPGSYELHAIAQGYARSQPLAVELPRADTGDIVDVTLRDGASMFGRVVDAISHEPLPLAHVFVRGIDAADSVLPGLSSTVTDNDGAFELSGIEPGRISVDIGAFAHDGKILSGIELAPDERHGPIEITLTPVAAGERPKTEIAGIGVAIGAVDDTLVINEVIEGGGAEAAGLVAGDRITAVDGESVLELGFEDAIQNIRGQAGTRVLLDLLRSDGEREQIEVERRIIRQG